MSQLEIVDSIVDKSLAKIGEDFKYKVDCHKIFFKWRELVGDDADEIFPVQISGSTLTLYSDNSSLKDKFKYRIPQLIEQINSICGTEIVTKIIFGQNFSENKIPLNKQRNLIVHEPEIILTEDEILECKEKAAVLRGRRLWFIKKGSIMRLQSISPYYINNFNSDIYIAKDLAAEDVFNVFFPFYDNDIHVFPVDQNTDIACFLKDIPGYIPRAKQPPKDHYYDSPIITRDHLPDIYAQHEWKPEPIVPKVVETPKQINIIECPYCHSNDTKKIGTVPRSVSFGIFGFGSSKIGKQWHCNRCKSDF